MRLRGLIGTMGPRGLRRPRGLMGLMGPMGLIGLIGLIGLMGLMGLMGCGGSDLTELPTTPPVTPTEATEVAISFSGHEEESQMVERGGNRADGTKGANRAYGANEADGAYRAGRRAGSPLSERGVTRFTVWGYKNMSYENGAYEDLQTVFPGYTVNWISGSAATTSSNTNGWEYVAQQTSGTEQTIKYWDGNAKGYRFFGKTEGANGTNETNGANGANETYRAYELTADCSSEEKMAEAPYFTHLWFSTGNVGDYPDKQFGKPVTLEFLKPFARVRFLFNYSYAPEGVKVEEPRFMPTADLNTVVETEKVKIALKGTVKVIYPLVGTETCERYEVRREPNPGAGELLDAFNEAYVPEGTEKWYTVLPALTQGSYTMSVKVNGEARTAVVPAEYMSWKPGYSYTYIFKITEEGGVEIDLVQSAVTSWTDMEIDHTVYNW